MTHKASIVIVKIHHAIIIIMVASYLLSHLLCAVLVAPFRVEMRSRLENYHPKGGSHACMHACGDSPSGRHDHPSDGAAGALLFPKH
jgi:hypothetical protein